MVSRKKSAISLITGVISDIMPKFMMYSKLDHDLLTLLLLRMTEIEDNQLYKVKKMLFSSATIQDIIKDESGSDSENNTSMITPPITIN